MSDETQALGNEGQDGGEPRESAETPERSTPESQDSPSAGEAQDAGFWKRKYLAAKDAEEELNRLRKAQEAPTPPPVAAGEWQPKPGTIEYFAAQGDPVALEVLRERHLQDQLDLIPMDDRAAVRKKFREEGFRYGDYLAAHEAVKAERLSGERDELRRKSEELEKRLAALEKGPDPEVVRNSPPVTREISARERKSRDMTERELYAEAARIEAEGGYVARLKFLKGLEGPNPAIRLKE